MKFIYNILIFLFVVFCVVSCDNIEISRSATISPLAIYSISPTRFTSNNMKVTLTGKGFVVGSRFWLGGALLRVISVEWGMAYCEIESKTEVLSGLSLSGFTSGLSALRMSSPILMAKVRNPNGQEAYLKTPFEFMMPPQIQSVTPNRVRDSGGTVITVLGRNLLEDTKLLINGFDCIIINYISDTSLSCAVPANSPGVYDINAINSDDQEGKLINAITYFSPANLNSVSPSLGSEIGGTVIHLHGSQFNSAMTISLGGAPCLVIGAVSSSDLDCVTSSHAPGIVDIILTLPTSEISLFPLFFTYTAAPPHISSLLPASGPVTGGTNLQVIGSFFHAGAIIYIDGVPCITQVLSTGILSCDTPSHIHGNYNVVVKNPDGQISNARTFNYIAAPAIVSMTPSFGLTIGNSSITILGSGFNLGSLVNWNGNLISANFISSTELRLFSPVGSGTVPVKIKNSDGQESNSITFNYGIAPFIATITPNQISIAGGQITLDGLGFTANATVLVDGLACTPINIINPQNGFANQLTCLAPPHSEADVDVSIATTYGSYVLPNSLHYVNNCTAALPFDSISRGYDTTCAISPDNQLNCWGANERGQYGNGTYTYVEPITGIRQNESRIPVLISPNHAIPPVSGWKKVVSGQQYECALSLDNHIYCWGSYYGAMGFTTTAFTIAPQIGVPIITKPTKINDTSIPLADRNFKDVEVGPSQACGVTTTDKIYCWGWGYYDGGNGYQDRDYATLFAMPIGFVYPIKQISLPPAYVWGASVICILDSVGKAFCHGDGSKGQLGTGSLLPPSQSFSTQFQAVDHSLLQSGEVFESLSVGYWHVCGVTNQHRAYCWGTEDYVNPPVSIHTGSLGNGNADSNHYLPSPIFTGNMPQADNSFLQIEAGYMETCAVTSTNKIYCWGKYYPIFGVSLSAGNNVSLDAPLFSIDTSQITGSRNFVNVQVTELGVCGLTSDGTGFCWGEDSNNVGVLGGGNTNGFGSFTPIPVGGNQNKICPSILASHIVFYTSQLYSGDLGGLSGADSKCQSAANGASLVGTWKAIISDDTHNAKDRIQINGPVRNNGPAGQDTVLANNANEFWSGTLLDDLKFNENKQTESVINSFAHTGSTPAGIKIVGRNCGNWTDSTLAPYQRFGQINESSGWWLSYYYMGIQERTCPAAMKIYCINQ